MAKFKSSAFRRLRARVWTWAVRIGLPWPARRLHRFGWSAALAGDLSAADLLFQRAAMAYCVEYDADGHASARAHRALIADWRRTGRHAR